MTDANSCDSQQVNYNCDPLLSQSSDHPGLQLVNTKLNGANFQP